MYLIIFILSYKSKKWFQQKLFPTYHQRFYFQKVDKQGLQLEIFSSVKLLFKLQPLSKSISILKDELLQPQDHLFLILSLGLMPMFRKHLSDTCQQVFARCSFLTLERLNEYN